MNLLPPATGDPAIRLRLRIAYAGHPPSINEAIRKRAVQTADMTAGWKANTIVAARQAVMARHLVLPFPPSVVRMTVPMPDARRRDPHNYTPTVVKACVDGLVASRFWPDDTAEYVVVVDPKLQEVPGLKDPRVQSRCHAILDIVPLASLRAALAGQPELEGLFDPSG